MNDDIVGDMHSMKIEAKMKDRVDEGDTETLVSVGINLLEHWPRPYRELCMQEYWKLLSKREINITKITPTTKTRIRTTLETTTTTITKTITTDSGETQTITTVTSAATTPEMKKEAETTARREGYFDKYDGEVDDNYIAQDGCAYAAALAAFMNCMNDAIIWDTPLKKIEALDPERKMKLRVDLGDTIIEGNTITSFAIGQNRRGPAFKRLSPKEYRKLMSKKVITVIKATPTTKTRIVTTLETTTTTVTKTITKDSGETETITTVTTADTTPEMKKEATTIARYPHYFDEVKAARDAVYD